MTGDRLTPRQRINLIIFLDEMTQDILRRRERGDRIRDDVRREQHRDRMRQRRHCSEPGTKSNIAEVKENIADCNLQGKG